MTVSAGSAPLRGAHEARRSRALPALGVGVFAPTRRMLATRHQLSHALRLLTSPDARKEDKCPQRVDDGGTDTRRRLGTLLADIVRDVVKILFGLAREAKPH